MTAFYPKSRVVPSPYARNQQAAADWRAGFVSCEQEILDPLPLRVRGRMPASVQGVLWRNGPSRLDVYGERLTHWFDGDGMVHALRIGHGQATLQSRFVQTWRKQQEDRAQKRLFPGFGITPRGGLLGKLRGYNAGNVANTNVIVFHNHVLALHEGGRPHRLDMQTLETLGEESFGGALKNPQENYTAHPKLNPDTGDMWGFAARYGRVPEIILYRTTPLGFTAARPPFALPFASLVHDFAITATRAVFVLSPWTLPRLPVGFLLGLKSMEETFRWRPQWGTWLLVMDLYNTAGKVRTYRIPEPMLMFHTVNAWDDDDGSLTVDICAMADAGGVQLARDVMAGDDPQPDHMPTVRRLHVPPDGHVYARTLSHTPFDFPRVAPSVRNQPHRWVYGVGWAPGAKFMGAPTCLDTQTGHTAQAPMGDGEFAGEGIVVPKRQGRAEQDVYLLSMVVNAPAQRSELRVYDGADLSRGDVARVELPHMLPFGFHGSWLADGSDTCI